MNLFRQKTKPKMTRKLSGLFILAIILSSITTLLLAEKAYADIVTCNDGSVHSNPTSDYACLGPGEGGVKSVAPNANEASKPGDICPANFANAGKKIPDGKDGTWCNTPEKLPCNEAEDICGF